MYSFPGSARGRCIRGDGVRGMGKGDATLFFKRILSNHGDHEIRAFEIVENYASDLRGGLGRDAVFTHSATGADWADWKPDLR